MNGGKIIEEEQNTNDCLMEARLTFRKLLSGHGLISLAGSEAETLAWLEGRVIELADSVSRRERFLELVRQVREGLKRMLTKTRQILVSELTFAQGCDEDEAEQLLDEVLG